MKSRKIVQMNLFSGRNRDADIENKHVDMGQKGDSGMDRDIKFDINTLPGVK